MLGQKTFQRCRIGGQGIESAGERDIEREREREDGVGLWPFLQERFRRKQGRLRHPKICRFLV